MADPEPVTPGAASPGVAPDHDVLPDAGLGEAGLGEVADPDDGVPRTVPVRRADPRLALVALAVLCAVCVLIGFALGRTL